MHAILIHGGAGVVPAHLAGAAAGRYESALDTILDAGCDILARGGSSLDAVTLAVQLLEDDPLFNAGRGAGLTQDGTAELDAAIMDGREQTAGAVACVKHVKNPVQLARCVMERSRYVMLVGSGAEDFALSQGLAMVPNQYFRTPERRQQLESEQRGVPLLDVVPAPQGTVGAVALDECGNLAAATSTGGLTNKLPGRVGDTPIIGAGTYAKNGVCAVSCTGYGEYFMRAIAAFHIAAAIEYRGFSVEAAVGEMLASVLPKLGGRGGIIAIDPQGRFTMQFNTDGMFRGAKTSQGYRSVAITR